MAASDVRVDHAPKAARLHVALRVPPDVPVAEYMDSLQVLHSRESHPASTSFRFVDFLGTQVMLHEAHGLEAPIIGIAQNPLGGPKWRC